MSTTAVTQTGSAPVDNDLLPDDPQYRLTGELPSEPEAPAPSEEPEEPQAEPSSEGEESAPPQADDSVTSAASETAPTQRTGKPKNYAQERIRELSAKVRELTEKLGSQQPQVQAPAAEPKATGKTTEPTMEDKNPDGSFKYKTFDEYMKAVRAYDREQLLAQVDERGVKAQREATIAEHNRIIETVWKERIGEARGRYADFDQIALNPTLPLKQGTVPDAFILDSDHGTDVLYYLGKNPKELERINGLNPIAQARALVKIEDKFAAAPVKRVSKAPPPVRVVGGHGGTSPDDVEKAVTDGDFADYAKSANARDMERMRARRRKG